MVKEKITEIMKTFIPVAPVEVHRIMLLYSEMIIGYLTGYFTGIGKYIYRSRYNNYLPDKEMEENPF
jgi:hypothetical protein